MTKESPITTRAEYMAELEKALKKLNIADPDEIMDEYQQHFDHKRADGYPDAEIIKKLGAPQTIARQFAEGGRQPGASRAVLSAGVGLLDLCMALLALVLLCWIIVLGAAAIGLMAASFGLILAWRINEFIPYIPYFGLLMLGLACLGLSALFALGTVYSVLFIRQWKRAYLRWRKNQFEAGRYPSLLLTPQMDASRKRRLRLAAVIALSATGACLVLGYVGMALSAGHFEFWHAWGWFL